MTTIRTYLASLLARLARAAATDPDARAKLSDVLVALGRGGPGAPR